MGINYPALAPILLDTYVGSVNTGNPCACFCRNNDGSMGDVGFNYLRTLWSVPGNDGVVLSRRQPIVSKQKPFIPVLR